MRARHKPWMVDREDIRVGCHIHSGRLVHSRVLTIFSIPIPPLSIHRSDFSIHHLAFQPRHPYQIHLYQSAHPFCLVHFHSHSRPGNNLCCRIPPSCLANVEFLSHRRHICGHENSRKVKQSFTIGRFTRVGVGWGYRGVYPDGNCCTLPEEPQNLHPGVVRGLCHVRHGCLVSQLPTHSARHTGGRGYCTAIGVVVIVIVIVAAARMVQESRLHCQYCTA